MLALAGIFAVLAVLWAFKLVTLQRSVSEHRAYWAQPRGAVASSDPLQYVGVGDSAAQGIGAREPTEGYVAILAKRLQGVTGRDVVVTNLSVSGARIDDVLTQQLPRLSELDTVTVTVAVGGNDIRAVDADTFRDQLERLMEALPEGTFVADVPYFMHGRWERDARSAATLTAQLAAEHGLVPVGLHEALREQGWQAMLTQFAADWFHPNDPGHRVWAEAFWSRMRQHPPVRALGR